MSAEEISLQSGPNSPALKVSIVGIGGAGVNLVDRGIEHGLDPSGCVAVNNDTGQLSRCVAPNKVFIGATTKAVSKLERNEITRFFQSSAHRITPFTQDSDFTIVVAGLGGITGTTTAPFVAQYNRTTVKPVVSIVAIPFIHERERRFVALRGLQKMVSSCDSTIIIDNSMQSESLESGGRTSDTTASMALETLSKIIRSGDRNLSRRLLNNLSSGTITMFATAIWTHRDTVQSVVYNALKSPSTRMPFSQAKAAALVYSGPGQLTMLQAAKAYETVVSLVGHDVEFLSASVNDQFEPRVSIFLSGYNYETALGSFVEFIQELYDLEYGEYDTSSKLGLQISLSEMEEA